MNCNLCPKQFLDTEEELAGWLFHRAICHGGELDVKLPNQILFPKEIAYDIAHSTEIETTSNTKTVSIRRHEPT